MNLDTAAIIGLSRQPLDEQSQALAAELMQHAGAPAEEALALLSARSLAHRANLTRSAVQRTNAPVEIPDHPNYGLLNKHLFNYLEASLAFRGSADVKTLYDRGAVIPLERMLWFLEAVIRKANVSPQAFSLLGRRGLWLALKHPTFKKKVAFLDIDTFPKSVKQRDAYVQFWWSELLRAERAETKDMALINRFRKLITAAKVSPKTFGLLQAVLDKGVLTKVPHEARGSKQNGTINPALFIGMFSRKLEMTDLEVLHLECLLDAGRKQKMLARAEEVLSKIPAGISERGSFEVLAKAAISSNNSTAAATLLQSAIRSQDRLLLGQKILPKLAAVLDSTRYAELLDYAHDFYPKGWKAPMVIAFLAASPYPFSPRLSEELANEVVHGYAPPSETVAGRYPHKLNPLAFGHLLSLKQEIQSESLNALVAMLLAKQRIDSAFPVS